MEGFEHLEIQLEEIKSATNNFSEENVIGHGGFGKVYKGELSHFDSKGKSMVALKRLDRRHGQGDAEFHKEVRMLSCYRHENIISLLGFSSGRDEMILVYEYASRGSLDRHLNDVTFTWKQRIKVSLDAAKGLCYLHDPRETNQRLIHCDIKSANILLLDENFKAKVSDFGLSKIGPANQWNSILVTESSGTPGYCDPVYMETYTLTKESDVYSFGIVLFEVLCGKLCVEYSNDRIKVIHVPMWKQSYERKRLSKIVLQGLTEQMNPDSLEIFADIAYKCLKRFREERPTMSLVIEKLQESLALQEIHDLELPKEYVEIVMAAVPPLKFRSLDELKVLLTKGFHMNQGKTLVSITEKGELIEKIYIEACVNPDEIEAHDLQHPPGGIVNSRFPGGRCYKYVYGTFKARVRGQYLTPQISYMLNLVFRYIWESNVNSYNVLRYKLDGEAKVFIIYPSTHMREDGWFVAPLYHFTSHHTPVDIQFEFEECPTILLVAGIEFQPSEEKVELQVFEEYQDIVEVAAQSLVYRSLQELKQILRIGIYVKDYKTWFSINDKEEHCLMLSIEHYLIPEDPNRHYSDEYSSDKNSRFVAGCYKAHTMKFKMRIITPLFLSPHVTYAVNLVFQYSKIKQMKQQSFPVKYKLLGETKISVAHVGDMREDGWLVCVLYHFTNDGVKSNLDPEIIFEDCGLSGYFYVEGIEFQPLGRLELVVAEYEEIVKDAVTPLFYRSVSELKLLLTRGILLNECKTMFCLTEMGQHIERIFIDACLDPDEACKVQHRDDSVTSRFPGRRCYEYDNEFKVSVRSQYLTSQISYTLNLVFRYRWNMDVNSYNPLKYKIEGEDETKVFIIYPTTHMREDGWFVVPLYQFTSEHAAAHLQFEFQFRPYMKNLLVAGIEFQPSEENVELQVFEEYRYIIEAASQSLFYTSLNELKQILRIGIHLKDYKRWFSLNKKGEHCEMISMKDCLILDEDFIPQYKSDSFSRFPTGVYETNRKGFKIHVKTEFLSPLITYTMNLVFEGDLYPKAEYINFKCRLKGETTTSTVNLANRRKADYFYITELYQFNSEGSIVDIEIDFEDHGTYMQVEGISFEPRHIQVELQVLEEYQYIGEVASQSLSYRSLEKLIKILRIGIHLIEYKAVIFWLCMSIKIRAIEKVKHEIRKLEEGNQVLETNFADQVQELPTNFEEIFKISGNYI